MKYILLLLGPNYEYLNHMQFTSAESMDKWLEDHEPFIMENIKGDLSLRERLKLLPQYFTFAGQVQNWEIIEIEQFDGGKE